MKKRLDVFNEYMRTKSYSKTGRAFGISRQRVYQIIRDGDSTDDVFRKKKNEIKKRDGNRCQWGEVCDQKERFLGLVVHHIDGNPYNNLDENLITLCTQCHAHFHARNTR